MAVERGQADADHAAVKGPAPYPEPVLGRPYGGYIGMTGNWAQWQRCGDRSAWSPSNSAAANTNFTQFHIGIGTGVYWFMGGPGVDSIYEWTYMGDTSSLSPRPTAWCLRGTSNCAQFFGGVTSNSTNAVMWQWSGGGGTSNGFGDFDQIDVARTPA